MKTYTLQACENYINKYVNEYGGELTIIEEGCLGLGNLILHSAKGKKSIVIKEVFVNTWVSTHTVKMYNKLPKKYAKLLN